jgi:hypothetical protein
MSWPWSYGSWIYNYLCSKCLSPLMFWVQIPLRLGVLDITLCDKVWQWLVAGRWFSLGTLVSYTNKTDRHDITEILLKVALSTITLTPNPTFLSVDGQMLILTDILLKWGLYSCVKRVKVIFLLPCR